MRRLLVLAVLSFIAFSAFSQSPKREFRGGWIHIVGNTKIKDMTTPQVKAMFTEVLDSMQSAGCNAVIFQVRPCADAF